MQLSDLTKLDGLFVKLAREMIDIRRTMEMTRSASIAAKKCDVIVLSDEWEVISAPDEPVPHYAYKAQESYSRSRKCSHC